MSAPTVQPRARGVLRVAVKRRGEASVLQDLHQAGSLRMLFPRPVDRTLSGVIINCAGGLTGGDRFAVEAVAQTGTTMTLTTQAAERIYRAANGEFARLTTDLTIGAGARLNWLPQETILFDCSAFARTLRVNMEDGAHFLMVEPLVFGRTAMGEHLRGVSFTDQVRLYRGGALVHADATRLNGDVEAGLPSAAITAGGRAVASIIMAGPLAEQHLDAARGLIGRAGGASLKAPDLLSIRLIASDAMALRRTAIPLIALLSGTDIPKTWTL